MLDAPPDADEKAAASNRGALIVVVGPSGAGKDSLIGYARKRLANDPQILFVRRVVTRNADVASEDHDAMTRRDFVLAEAAGAFAVTWEAHGLLYGIPSAVRRHVEAGGTAIANGSRAALPQIALAFSRMKTVYVTARPEVLVSRLAARGREDHADIEQRLLRSALQSLRPSGSLEIDNSGDLAIAGEAMVALIRGAEL